MDETEVAEIVGELRRKHAGATADRDLSDFELTLGLLPDPWVWKVSDLAPSAYLLGPRYTLSTITLGVSPQPGLPCAATLSTKTLDGEKLTAHLEWGEYLTVGGSELWRRTHWTFPLTGQADGQLEEWQRVTGSVRLDAGQTGLDYDERYARGVFERIGRAVSDSGAVAAGDRDVHEQPPPAPSDSAGQPVTDIWGNPLEKRRRRRR